MALKTSQNSSMQNFNAKTKYKVKQNQLNTTHKKIQKSLNAKTHKTITSCIFQLSMRPGHSRSGHVGNRLQLALRPAGNVRQVHAEPHQIANNSLCWKRQRGAQLSGLRYLSRLWRASGVENFGWFGSFWAFGVDFLG